MAKLTPPDWKPPYPAYVSDIKDALTMALVGVQGPVEAAIAAPFADLSKLLAGADGGLSGSLQSFVNAWHDLANDPASAASRQALLSETQTLLARFDFMDQRLTAVSDEIRSRLTASAAEITDLGAGIADINRQLVLAGRTQPPELLDRAERLVTSSPASLAVEHVTEVVQGF